MADGRRLPGSASSRSPQTVAAAGALRRLAGHRCSRLEHPHPTVDAMLAQFADWETRVAPPPCRRTARRASAPTVHDTQRVYLVARVRHRRVQPVLPGVPLRPHRRRDAPRGASPSPLSTRGHRDLVHGGFLAVFFDCVIQHQNCATALSGKTRSLNVTFRRPTPVLTELRFDIVRSQVDDAVSRRPRGCCSTTRCSASAKSTRWRWPRTSSPAFHFGKRRG